MKTMEATNERRSIHTTWSLKPHLAAFSPDDGGAPGTGTEGTQAATTPADGTTQTQTTDSQGQRQLTADEKKQIAEFRKQIQAETLGIIEQHGYEIKVGDNGLEITKKGAKQEPPTQKQPTSDDMFASYASDMRAAYAKEGLDPPTDKELKASYVREVIRTQHIGTFTKKQINAEVQKALDTVMERFDKDDRAKWYSGDRAFLKEMEGDIDRLLTGEGSAKDVDKLIKAAMKREREKIVQDETGKELRAKLMAEGHMEAGGKASGPTPSITTLENHKALGADIRKAAAAGDTAKVNALLSKRRLYAE